MWRRLKHSNIVPFIGVTLSPLQIVSEWMPSGNLIAYIRSNPDADKVALVSHFFPLPHHLIVPAVGRRRERTPLPPPLRRGPRRPERSEFFFTIEHRDLAHNVCR